jgi:hypothetical protein
MKFYILLITLVVNLYGCSTTEISEEKKQKLAKDIKLYNETVLKPVVFTSLATCAYKLEKEDWPTFITQVEESKLLSNYEVVSENPFVVQFQVKPSIVKWKVEYSHVNNECLYSISLKSTKAKANSRLKGKINKEEIKSLNRENIDKHLGKDLMVFSFFVFKTIELHESKKVPEKNQAFEELLSVLGEVTLRATVCLLLGASAGNC